MLVVAVGAPLIIPPAFSSSSADRKEAITQKIPKFLDKNAISAIKTRRDSRLMAAQSGDGTRFDLWPLIIEKD